MPYDAPARYFDRMDMHKILARIDARIAEMGTNPSAVSRKATGSPDTIRNWKRRADRGEMPGASTVTLQPIADALDVPLDWLIGNGPDSLEEYLGSDGDRAKLMKIYDRLDPRARAVALRQISALVQSEEEEPSSTPSGTGD